MGYKSGQIGPNGTNMELFEKIYQDILTQRFVSFVVNLTLFEAETDIPGCLSPLSALSLGARVGQNETKLA